MAGKVNKIINVKVEGVGKIKQLEDSLKKLRKQQRDIKKDMKDGANAGKHAEQQYKKNENAIKSQSKALRETKKAMLDANNTTKKATSLQNSMAMGVIKGAAAFSILVTAFRRVNQALTTLIGTFTEFEFTMAKVKAVSGATPEEFKRLTAAAEELGRSTFFTASEVANLQLNLSKLGFTVEEIESATEATINLSIATGSDLARAATVAGNAVRGFQLDATETGRVVDVMAVAFTSSALDIEKWQTSMTKVAPIAAMAGFSIEETTAIMAKLSDTGIEASIAGTSLRNIFLKMQDPTSDLTKRVGHTITNLDEMAVAFEKLQKEGADLADILSFMDVRQVAAFGTMLEGITDIKALRDELMLAEGAGEAMAHTVGDTLQGSIFKIKSALQGVSIALVKQFGGAMKKTFVRLAEWFNALVDSEEKLKKFWETLKFTTKIILGFVIGLKPARALLKFIAADAVVASGAMTGLTIATNLAKLAFNGLKLAIASTGIGLAVIALGELVTWMMFAQTETEMLANVTDSYGRKIQEIIDIERTKKEIDDEIIAATTKKAKTVDILIRAYKRAKGSEEDRLRILDKLADISEKHFGHLRGQVDAFDDAQIAAENYKEELKKLAKVEATKGALVDVEGEILKMEMEYEKAITATYAFQRQVRSLFKKEDYPDFTVAVKKYVDIFEDEGDYSREYKAYLKITAGLGDEILQAREWRDDLQKKIDEMDMDDLFDFDDEKSVSAEYSMQEKIEIEKANTEFVKQEEQHRLNMLNAKLRGIKAFRKQANVSKDEDRRADIAEKETKRAIDKAAYNLALDTLKKELVEKKNILRASDEFQALTKAEQNVKLAELDTKFYKEQKDKLIEHNQDIADIESKIAQDKLANEALDLEAADDKLTKQYETDKLNLDLALANEQITEIQHKEGMLVLEAMYLSKKADLYVGHGEALAIINNQIKANDIETTEHLMDSMNSYIGKIGELGQQMTDLAGEEEKLAGLRKAGVVITQVAATAESILAIATTVRTLATTKGNLAEAIKISMTGASVASDVSKTTSTVALAGATFLKSIADGIRNMPWWAQLLGIVAIVAAISKAKKAISSSFQTPDSGGDGGTDNEGGMMSLMTFGGRHQTVGEIDGYAKGGMVHGKSHAQGGEKFAVGGRVVELEGGEAVINKRSTSMFRSQLSAMNYAGGGVSFADGGVTNIPSFAKTQFDVAGQQGLQGAMSQRSKVVVVEADITQSQNTVSAIESEAAF